MTSDGGLLLVRELDERLGLGKLIDEHLTDSRQGSNKKFPLVRSGRDSRSTVPTRKATRTSTMPFVSPPILDVSLAGLEEKLGSRWGAHLADRQSFEAELLASEENLLGLMAVNRELSRSSRSAGPVRAQSCSIWTPPRARSTVSRKASAYNGHFESTCYHPLLLFIPARRLSGGEDCDAGNVSSAEDWDELLLPEIERATGRRETRDVPGRRSLRQAGDLRSVVCSVAWTM